MMAGNSSRKGAVRKQKKGATAGSGGKRARGLAGKGPTPKATERTGHPAARRAAAAERRAEKSPRRVGGSHRKSSDAPELLVGRNPVAEALRAEIPANALYVAVGIEADERVTAAIHLAADRGLPILEVSKAEIDRRTGGILHQGIALQVPAFQYDELPDLLDLVSQATTTPLLVALDGVTDPRNLGAVIRSAVAFGAQGADSSLGWCHGDGMAHLGGHRGQDPGGAGDEPGACPQGLPEARVAGRRFGRRR
jgi:23S rRNA (guanosine2251-2'-O)-methyltransferase